MSISSQHEKIRCVSGVLYPEVIPSTNFNTFVNVLLSSIAFSLLLQIYNIFLLKLMRDSRKQENLSKSTSTKQKDNNKKKRGNPIKKINQRRKKQNIKPK